MDAAVLNWSFSVDDVKHCAPVIDCLQNSMGGATLMHPPMETVKKCFEETKDHKCKVGIDVGMSVPLNKMRELHGQMTGASNLTTALPKRALSHETLPSLDYEPPREEHLFDKLQQLK